ncbi:hypothetical protein AB0465_14475 [Streptomyces griseoviridis]|uniref:hypothetical protein n=1 Tax=Streptomyces griseoviridis TaxID=45398 RepID=UPI00344B87A8
MSEPTASPNSAPIPPMETIDDDKRYPARNRPTHPNPTMPRPAPIRTRDDISPGALAVGAVLGTIILIFIVKWAIQKVIDWLSWFGHQDWSWATQWAATVTDPVHAYLAAHTAGLPVTATSAFGIWLGVGAASLVLAWLTKAVGARLTWLAHGTATVFMVWEFSEPAGAPSLRRWPCSPGRSAVSSRCAACPCSP